MKRRVNTFLSNKFKMCSQEKANEYKKITMTQSKNNWNKVLTLIIWSSVAIDQDENLWVVSFVLSSIKNFGTQEPQSFLRFLENVVPKKGKTRSSPLHSSSSRPIPDTVIVHAPPQITGQWWRQSFFLPYPTFIPKLMGSGLFIESSHQAKSVLDFVLARWVPKKKIQYIGWKEKQRCQSCRPDRPRI